METVGIIGGVGPLAGALFYQRLIELTDAADDQSHLAVVLISDPIPSRVAHLLGRGQSPGPALARAARRLEAAGARVIAISSVTTHAYREEIAQGLSVPLVDGLRAIGAALNERHIRHPVILATTATATRRLLDRHLPSDINPIYPDPGGQARVMAVIDTIKSGRTSPELAEELGAVTREAWAAGSDGVVLACTELPLLARWFQAPQPVVDSTEVMARAVIRAAGGRPCPPIKADFQGAEPQHAFRGGRGVGPDEVVGRSCRRSAPGC